MLCDVCQEKNASVYLTQIVDNQMQKVNLCHSCSKAKGVEDPTGFALADVLMGLGSETRLAQIGEETACESCGFTQSDFKKTGRLGCSECYGVFREHLEGLLKAMHKGTRHHGKVPARYLATRAFVDHLDELKHRLKIAVSDENFEEAARLRDQISTAEEAYQKEQG